MVASDKQFTGQLTFPFFCETNPQTIFLHVGFLLSSLKRRAERIRAPWLPRIGSGGRSALRRAGARRAFA